MKSIYLYIVGILVIVGVAVTPLIVRQNFTKSLKIEKKVLLKRGVKLTIKNEKGYFNGIISFNLQIVDGKLFRDYMLNEIITANPSFIPISKAIMKRGKRDIGVAFDGITFDGNIRHSNIFLHKTEVELALVKLSDDTMNKIDKKEEIKNLIDPLLREKVLTFFIDIDSKQNITEVRIKDIDRAFKLKNKETYDFKLVGNKLTINNTKRMAGVYTFDDQLLRVNSGYKSLLFQIQGFDYKFDYLNQLDSVIGVHADSFNLDIKQRFRATNFKFKNLDINSSIEATSSDTVDINIGYALNNIYMKSYMKVVKLDKAKLNIAILGISKQDLIDFSKIYNDIILRGKYNSKYNSKALIKSFTKMVNMGFKFNINLSFSKLKAKNFMLNDINVEFKSKLNPNKASMSRAGIKNLFDAFSTKGVVTMDKQDLELMSSKNRKLSKLASFAKKEANKAIFNVDFKSDKLFINNKRFK